MYRLEHTGLEEFLPREGHVHFEKSAEIDSPLDVVWKALVDIERWPTWTGSMRELTWIDEAGMSIGSRARVRQPKMPTLVWEVCELEPGVSFSWSSQSVGVRTVGSHLLKAIGPNRTSVTLGISQSGALSRLLGTMTGRMAVRYIEMECEGLKHHCESRTRPGSVPGADPKGSGAP